MDIICSAISPKSDTTTETVASLGKIKAAFKLWRDGGDSTYRSLRQLLDQLSVFAGKCPLVSDILPKIMIHFGKKLFDYAHIIANQFGCLQELAGIGYRDFDESLLPMIKPAVTQSSGTNLRIGSILCTVIV